MRPKRYQKYGNKAVVTSDGRFDSEREYKQWCELKLLQLGKKIRHLQRQVTFRLDVRGQHICRYIADFVYEEKQADGSWKRIVHDAKGFRTDVYKIKKKLMLAVHGIEIREQ